MSAPCPDPRLVPTLTIPEAGAILGLGRSASFEAAARGAIPTLAISPRRRIVPTARLAEMLGLAFDVTSKTDSQRH